METLVYMYFQIEYYCVLYLTYSNVFLQKGLELFRCPIIWAISVLFSFQNLLLVSQTIWSVYFLLPGTEYLEPYYFLLPGNIFLRVKILCTYLRYFNSSLIGSKNTPLLIFSIFSYTFILVDQKKKVFKKLIEKKS